MRSRWATTRRGLLLGAVAGTAGIGIGAPGVVLPDVAEALGVAEDATAWVLAAFVLGSGVAMTLGGRALDLLGSRKVALAGAIGMVLGTVAIALGDGLGVVAAGRFVQGAGSGWLCITAFNAVSYVPEEDRPRVGGVLTALSFSCIAASPLIGALLEVVAGWRGVLCAGASTLIPMPWVLRVTPRTIRGTGRLDLRGAAYATVGSVSIAAVLQGASTDMPIALVVALALLAAAMVAALALHLRRRPDGFLPLAVLRNRELITLSVSAAMLQAAYSGLIFAAPLLLAREAGWDALESGLALAPGALIGATSAHLAGTIGARRHAPAVLLRFCVVSAAGLLVAGLGSSVAALVVAGTLLTIGPYAGVQAVMLGRVSTLVAEEDIGAATGTFTYVFITGGMLGVAAAGGLASIVGLGPAVGLLVVLPLAGAAAAVQIGLVPARAMAA